MLQPAARLLEMRNRAARGASLWGELWRRAALRGKRSGSFRCWVELLAEHRGGESWAERAARELAYQFIEERGNGCQSAR